MTKVTDLRKQQAKVPFASLKVGQAYEDSSNNFCIKTSASFNDGDNCMYFNTCSGEWESEYEVSGVEKVLPLNIEINILP